MKKRALVAVGAGSLMAAGIIAPATAMASDHNRGKLCHQNRFFVVHQGDSIIGANGNKVSVPQGYYKTYVRNIPCSSAIIDLHNWLGFGQTSNGWTVDKGGRGVRSLKFADPKGGSFIVIKRVKNQ